MFTHCPEIEALAAAHQEEVDADGQHNGQIDHETVAEDQAADGEVPDGQGGQARDGGPVGRAGGGHRDLPHAAGHGVQAAAEEVGHAAAEDGQGQAGDVLVGPEGDGEKAVEQAAQRRGQEGRGEGEDEAEHRGGIRVVELVEEGGRQTGDAAQVHDAGDAQVQIAGFLGEDLTHGAEEDDGAEDHCRLQQLYQLGYAHLPSASFPRTMTR